MPLFEQITAYRRYLHGIIRAVTTHTCCVIYNRCQFPAHLPRFMATASPSQNAYQSPPCRRIIELRMALNEDYLWREPPHNMPLRYRNYSDFPIYIFRAGQCHASLTRAPMRSYRHYSYFDASGHISHTQSIITSLSMYLAFMCMMIEIS